jgi:phage baseplate assembly protein W
VTEDFVGAGWAFPLRADSSGSVALSSGDREIAEAIRLVLATAPGERPMRPEFGCGIHKYVFDPADSTTSGLIAFEVKASLRRWEPRIEVLSVDVAPDPYQQSRLYVDIRYNVRGSNDPRNLVFPFYVIPEES